MDVILNPQLDDNFNISDDEDEEGFKTVPTPRTSTFTKTMFSSNDVELKKQNFFQRAKAKLFESTLNTLGCGGNDRKLDLYETFRISMGGDENV